MIASPVVLRCKFHPQEMTERIGTKIKVRRTSGGQSQVTVS